MGVKQLSFFEEVDESAVRKEVRKLLKRYKAIKVNMQNKKEQEEVGVVALFPSLRESEKKNELIVKQIDRALQYSLDDIEREIIQLRYLGDDNIKDTTIFNNLGIKKDPYYAKKKEAILQLATALGII